MLKDEQILPACYHYASKLCSKKVSYNELVNVGYINCKPLNNPKNVGMWAKYTMLQFICRSTDPLLRLLWHPKGTDDERLSDVSCVLKAVSIVDDNGTRFDVVDKSYLLDAQELQESIKAVIDESCNNDEKAIISMRYWQDMTQGEIGDALGITKQSVNVKIKSVLAKLKKAYKKRL